MARRRTAPTETESTDAPAFIAEFVGSRDNEGRPVEFFSGIPARNLFQRDIDRLNDEQRDIVKGSHLYRMVDEDKEEDAGDGDS